MTWTNGDAELLARVALALERIADAQERLLAIEAQRQVAWEDHRDGITPDRSPVLGRRTTAVPS